VSDPMEHLMHGSHVDDVTAMMYLFWSCPYCGAQHEGTVEATVDEDGTTSFNFDCSYCEQQDLLVELSLVRRNYLEEDDA